MPDAEMSADSALLYLEHDDEIPSIVRRLHEADAPRIILVAAGRTKATTSAIGMRLLAQQAAASGRELVLVADAAARALAAEAGIPAFASIVDAQGALGGQSAPLEPAPAPRAAIHIVRGDRVTAPSVAGPTGGLRGIGRSAASPSPGMDDTQPVVVAVPPRQGRPRSAAPHRPPKLGRRSALVLATVVLVVVALVAAFLPAATVQLVPAVTEIGPVSYALSLPAQSQAGTLSSDLTAGATGTYDDSTPAKGVIVFANYSNDRIQIARGTQVAAADQIFTTDATIVVPDSSFLFGPGTQSVSATAAATGPAGNVGADAIDTVVDKALSRHLRASGSRRVVDNPSAMTGGATKTGPQIVQKDVDALVARIKGDLEQQLASVLAADAARVYAAPAQPEDPVITVPTGLVGTKDQASFGLHGTLQYDRRYVTSAQLVDAARQRLEADAKARPAGTTIVGSSVRVVPSEVTAAGDQVAATAAVTAAVVRQLDLEALKAQIAGMSAADAASSLRRVGSARIRFWPGWVDALPRLPFRIEITVDAPAPAATPVPTSSSSPSRSPAAS